MKSGNVSDLMGIGDFVLWIVGGLIFWPWFFIHPLLLVIISHKRKHAVPSYSNPMQHYKSERQQHDESVAMFKESRK